MWKANVVTAGAISVSCAAVILAQPTDPVCWTSNPVLVCDRNMPTLGQCPPVPVTNPPCGYVTMSAAGYTEFTTFDQRQCVYQPRKTNHQGGCDNDGDPVTAPPVDCQSTAGTVCGSGGGET